MAQVLGFDHVSIIVAQADKSLAFYQGLLGLSLLERPKLGFPGYWLDLGAGQSLHLMQLANPYAHISRPAHGGRDVHFALRVDSVEAFAERLLEQNLPFTLSQSGRKALFVRDLDDNAFELFEFN
ncbi:MAG: VOC family protein [Thiomicrospira sp.]|jgi:glyoxylase I family protein|nr:VOC family protein [Thiomicrospira sp.]